MERRKILVTGAASGIGRATAVRFASEGYDVCVNDINTGQLEKMFKELPAGNHLLLPGSYAEKSTVTEGERLIQQAWGTLNTLVNCAGIFEKTDPIEMEIQRWRVIFDCMLNGCMQMTRLAVKFMNKGGRIIHITSIHGTRAE